MSNFLEDMAQDKYGIGMQDFADMIERNFVYVDKTQYIIKLLEGSDLYFLSRPRRFGKSLFLSTLKNFFLGRRELFKGMAIDSYDWDWIQYPVIHISFAQGSFADPEGLKDRISQMLFYLEEDFGLEKRFDKPSERFGDLIRRLRRREGRKVVVLIDEYEKPLLDAYGTPGFDSSRNELSGFYSALKDNTENIRLLFITGVTRFGQLNIFSGLNNLRDISLSDDFAAVCGITEDEIRAKLIPGIQKLAEKEGCSSEEVFRKLKRYYDGYHFSESLTDVYNPWSVFNCLREGRFSSDWFRSGSPSYLLKILKEKEYDLESLLGSEVSENKLTGFGVDVMDPTALLYQSGYLTISKYDRQTRLFTIGLPNYEVRTALFEAILPYYLGKDKELTPKDLVKLATYIERGEAENMMRWLSAYFSKISFISKLRFERDFQFLVVSIFLLIKDFCDVHCEYSLSSGIADIVVEVKEYVYVFEFKIGDNAGEALSQINFRRYDLPWSADRRRVFKIGAAFSTDNNGILHYIIE